MLSQLNFVTAFVAGVLSFFSPCALPLVPLFLSHLGGVTSAELNERGNRALLLRNAAAFVAGFSLVFIILFGLAASLLGQVLAGQRLLLLQVSGVMLIAIGLNYLGLLKIPALWRERRISWQPRATGGLLASVFIGAAFALGWTPCIGAILATIVAMAATQNSTAQALGLLALYSLGLGLPFMVVAAGYTRIVPALRRFNRHFGAINRVSGALIVTVGAFMLFGAYQGLFTWLIRFFPWTPAL